jgi:hypothetical protein
MQKYMIFTFSPKCWQVCFDVFQLVLNVLFHFGKVSLHGREFFLNNRGDDPEHIRQSDCPAISLIAAKCSRCECPIRGKFISTEIHNDSH